MQNTRIQTLIQYVLPAILTNACVFILSVVDGIFIGNGVNTTALGAVNIAMPFVMIATAINMLTSIGGVTVTAIRFGRGDKQGANNAFMHALTVNILFSVIITIACVFFTTPISRLMGANDLYLPYVNEYIFWWGLLAVPAAVAVNLQSFCRNDGSPMLVAVATVTTTVLDLFLNWLMIFPLGMGVMGGAFSTGISQMVSMFIMLTHFVRKKGDLRICKYTPDRKLFRKVIFRGLPEMIAQFATPITTICMNHVLLANLGDVGVNAYSIISYIATIVMSVMIGASEGLQPLFGQSYGAKNDKDLKFYLRSGLWISIIGGGVLSGLSILFDEQLCILFGADATTLNYTVKYLPQYVWAFIVAGLNTVLSAYMYSTKRSAHAIAMNVVRSLIANTLIITLLPMIIGSEIVWFTFGISECVVLAVALALKIQSERNGVVYR